MVGVGHYVLVYGTHVTPDMFIATWISIYSYFLRTLQAIQWTALLKVHVHKRIKITEQHK